MVNSTDRNVDGILHYMRQYLAAREQQVVRINPKLESIIKDIAWIHLEILRNVLQKSKSFGGEKYRVADILTGADDGKRRALFGTSGEQNSIMDEIIERSDETGKAMDQSIHDMRTLFRAIDPELENLVQLIQHWMKWDLPDAADLHSFDEQIRRLTALCGFQFTDEVRARYRQALGKPADATVSDAEIFEFEMRRLDQVAGRFCGRRQEDEPYQLIICRDGCNDALVHSDGESAGESAGANGDDEESDPYNFKLRQCDSIGQRLNAEKQAVEQRIGSS